MIGEKQNMIVQFAISVNKVVLQYLSQQDIIYGCSPFLIQTNQVRKEIAKTGIYLQPPITLSEELGIPKVC